jgi:hypothetical protein
MLWPCPVDTRLASFWIAPLLSRLHSTPPLCRLPPGPRFGLVLMLAVAPVPHPLPLSVTCCFFFSSTDAILLSKLCLSSVLSALIKVSLVTLILEPTSPPLRPCSQLNRCWYKTSYLSFTQSTLRLTSFFVGLVSFSTRVLVVLLPSTSSSPMNGV